MEPTCLTVLCDHVTAARGSSRSLYGQSKKALRILFHPGRWRVFDVHRGVVLQHQHGNGDVGLAGEGRYAALGQGEFDAEGRAEGEDFVAELGSVGGELEAYGGGG